MAYTKIKQLPLSQQTPILKNELGEWTKHDYAGVGHTKVVDTDGEEIFHTYFSCTESGLTRIYGGPYTKVTIKQLERGILLVKS